jgi:hypothetical protein
MTDSKLEELVEWAEKPTWAERKVVRQRMALDYIVRRNTSLRFAVRVMESVLGRPVTREEWIAARDALSNEAHKERIDAEPVSA